MPSRREFLLGAAGSMFGLLACDPGGTDCPNPGDDRINGVCVSLTGVRLNTVGFLPDRIKRATLASKATTFSVKRADGSTAHQGTVTGPVTDPDTGDSLWFADFTALTEEGQFHVDAPGAGISPTFTIGKNVYRDALPVVVLGLTGARCGVEISITNNKQTYTHGACHVKDAYTDYLDGKNVLKPSLRGWHDAGDYGKYIGNGAFAAGMVLLAWELFGDKLKGVAFQVPEHGGAIPDLLAEVKWELDWLLTTQFPDGSVSHKVTATSFEPLSSPPDGDPSIRYYAPIGTAATAAFVGVLAQASRIYAPFDAAFAKTCLEAATLSYAYLTANPKDQKPDLSNFTTGDYQTGDADDRIWAAGQMWETTGDPAALADFEKRAANSQIQTQWDWSDVGNLGLFAYVLSAREGRSDTIVAALTKSAVNAADSLVTRSNSHGYGRSVGSQYYWGINGTVARTTINFAIANRLSPKPAYLDAMVLQVDHLFGRNVYGRSFVTGLGHAPPISPHHRPSVSSGRPWPGLLVGGAWPKATSWVDDSNTFETNEVAINWTAPMIFALAAFVP